MTDRSNQHPYDAPTTDDLGSSQYPVATNSHLASFFAWYFCAFIMSELLWYLSAHVRAYDLLELPMASFHFPLAGFLAPHDWMVRSRNVFYYAVVFWGAVGLIGLRFAPTRFGPLLTALGIIAACSVASIIYTVAYHSLSFGQMI
jgi:hypothetical protein